MRDINFEANLLAAVQQKITEDAKRITPSQLEMAAAETANLDMPPQAEQNVQLGLTQA